MDVALTKFLIMCFVCELASFTSGIPVKDVQDSNNRHKRSPSNGFSFFRVKPVSFSIGNPIISVQTFNSFGNFLTPAPRNRNNENETPNYTNHKKHMKETPVNLTPTRNDNIDKSVITSPPETVTTTRTIVDRPDTNIANEKEKPNTHQVVINRGDHIPNEDEGMNDQDINVIEIDKSVVDSIFKDSTTTEDVTIDYTTETGEYETTTNLDELLRIPANVVASLLG